MFSSAQFEALGISKNKMEEMLEKYGIDAKDGIDPKEFNQILEKEGFVNSDSRISSAEMKVVLKAFGLSDEKLNSLDVSENSWMMNTDNSTIGYTVNDTESKNWAVTRNDAGQVTQSTADYNIKGQEGGHQTVTNKYEYNEDGTITKTSNKNQVLRQGDNITFNQMEDNAQTLTIKLNEGENAADYTKDAIKFEKTALIQLVEKLDIPEDEKEKYIDTINNPNENGITDGIGLNGESSALEILRVMLFKLDEKGLLEQAKVENNENNAAQNNQNAKANADAKNTNNVPPPVNRVTPGEYEAKGLAEERARASSKTLPDRKLKFAK